MKKLCAALILILLFSSVTVFGASPSDVLLFTCYTQAGWGDRVEAGIVDTNGDLWMLAIPPASAAAFPYDTGSRIEYVRNAAGLVHAGTLDNKAMEDARSLIYCLKEAQPQPKGVACDAGTQASYAVIPASSGTIIIPLGMSGDDMWENTQPAAQTLYRLLRDTFPEVTDFDGEDGIAPAGFVPAALSEYIGAGSLDLATASIKRFDCSCEEGLLERSIDTDEVELVLGMLAGSTVVGQANAMSLTGGTVIYEITDADGNSVCLELYHGLLVRSDGMYTIR